MHAGTATRVRGDRRLSSWLRRSDPTADVVPVMDALCAALSAGLTSADALRMANAVADTGGWLVPLAEAADEGRPLGQQWRRAARRVGHPDLAALAQAWTISERLGCPLADAVATAASTARARTAMAQRLSAATAGASATSTMLTLLPLGGLGLTLSLGLSPADLYSQPSAAASAVAGLTLLFLGRWMVDRMVAHVSARVG
ncbi:MAG: type II secretion system F family protein [Ornithinimicrobium sp.]